MRIFCLWFFWSFHPYFSLELAFVKLNERLDVINKIYSVHFGSIRDFIERFLPIFFHFSFYFIFEFQQGFFEFLFHRLTFTVNRGNDRLKVQLYPSQKQNMDPLDFNLKSIHFFHFLFDFFKLFCFFLYFLMFFFHFLLFLFLFAVLGLLLRNILNFFIFIRCFTLFVSLLLGFGF